MNLEQAGVTSSPHIEEKDYVSFVICCFDIQISKGSAVSCGLCEGYKVPIPLIELHYDYFRCRSIQLGAKLKEKHKLLC